MMMTRSQSGDGDARGSDAGGHYNDDDDDDCVDDYVDENDGTVYVTCQTHYLNILFH